MEELISRSVVNEATLHPNSMHVPIDTGGCSATALMRLGVISKNVDVVKLALDSCIAPAWKILKDGWQKAGKRTQPPESLAGIRGQEWHIIVIRIAIHRYDEQYVLRKLKLTEDGGCSELITTGVTGSFLVDGTLNRKFMRVGQKFRRTGEIFEQLGHDDIDKKHDNAWRHAIAIKGNRMFCSNLSDGGVTLANLWLNERGKPHPTKGYMKVFLKVYMLDQRNHGRISKKS
jgi:hypothetical protein